MTQILVAPEAVIQFNKAEKTAFERLKSEIPLTGNPDDLMDKLWELTEGIIPHDRIGIAFIDKNGEGLSSHLLKTSYDEIFMGVDYSGGLGRSSLRHLREKMVARIIPNLEQYGIEHPYSTHTALLLKEGVKCSITLPLNVQDKCVGFIFFSSRQVDVFKERHANLLLAVIQTLSYTLERLWRIAELERVKKSYMTTVGFVAHEMKSPLATAQTMLHTYLDGYFGDVNEAGHEAATGVNRLLEYMHSLVSNYLGLSQIESGEMKFSPEPGLHFVEEVLKFGIETVQIRAEKKGSNISLTIPDNEVVMDGDKNLLRIVAVNLIDNAVKYSPDNSEIEVKAMVQDKHLVFCTLNPGPGFTKEESKKLFKKFSRLNQKGMQDRKGTGLGLFLTYWIVQKHQGQIIADSEPGVWTRFQVKIPLEIL